MNATIIEIRHKKFVLLIWGIANVGMTKRQARSCRKQKAPRDQSKNVTLDDVCGGAASTYGVTALNRQLTRAADATVRARPSRRQPLSIRPWALD